MATAARWSGLVWTGAAKATPSVCWSASDNLARAASLAAWSPAGSDAARTSGPLKPGPKPLASWSKAWRVVSLVGSLPASVKASRIENSGTANNSSTARAARPVVHGWRCTVRLQRYQNPLSDGGAPETRTPGMRRRSIARPAKPNMAGSKVSAAAITRTTAAMALTARPCMNGRLSRNSPHSEMTTVMPANSTARPDVPSETATASRGSRPSDRPCRYRVTMNSA